MQTNIPPLTKFEDLEPIERTVMLTAQMFLSLEALFHQDCEVAFTIHSPIISNEELLERSKSIIVNLAVHDYPWMAPPQKIVSFAGQAYFFRAVLVSLGCEVSISIDSYLFETSELMERVERLNANIERQYITSK